MGSAHDEPTGKKKKKGQESCLNFKSLRNFRKDEQNCTKRNSTFVTGSLQLFLYLYTI